MIEHPTNKQLRGEMAYFSLWCHTAFPHQGRNVNVHSQEQGNILLTYTQLSFSSCTQFSIPHLRNGDTHSGPCLSCVSQESRWSPADIPTSQHHLDNSLPETFLPSDSVKLKVRTAPHCLLLWEVGVMPFVDRAWRFLWLLVTCFGSWDFIVQL